MSIRTEQQKKDRIKAFDIAKQLSLGRNIPKDDIKDVKVEVEKYLCWIKNNCRIALDSYNL